ncbi:MAG: hypothetical protein K2Z81_10610 [Cyanobacteria bacterium]|nr:hypothetical protein [Cyanobacteriota bacterium]
MRNPVTFESSMQQSAELIKRLDDKTISEDSFQTESIELLSSVSGARGFFVALLTGDWQFGNEVPKPVIQVCKAKSSITEELLTKNLIMSTCMEVEHGRKGAEDNRMGSLTVQRRSINIIGKIKSPSLETLLTSAGNEIDNKLSGTSQEGSTFADFLNRWPYDDQQLKAARNIIAEVLRTTFDTTH